MTAIVDLNRERAKREEPDADCVRKDDFPQPNLTVKEWSRQMLRDVLGDRS